MATDTFTFDGTEQSALAAMDWANPASLDEPAIAAAAEQKDGRWVVLLALGDGTGAEVPGGTTITRDGERFSLEPA